MNIAVFVSGSGSNLQAILDEEKRAGLAGGKVILVVSDNPGAYALERSKKAGVKTAVIEPSRFSVREEFDEAVKEILEENDIGLIVLAGFMRILTSRLIDAYRGKIINIHPSLLPAFKGAHGIRDAFDHGVKVTGVSVHFVTEELDGGPIIAQEAVRVGEKDNIEDLEKKIHETEHRLYPEVIKDFVSGKLKIENNRVIRN